MYQYWAVGCYWILCCSLTTLNSKHSCLLMVSHLFCYCCLNNFSLYHTDYGLYYLCNCSVVGVFVLFVCLFPLSIPLMHLSLNPGYYVQAEINRMVEDKQENKQTNKRQDITYWFQVGPLLQPGLPLLLSWKTVLLFVVENKIEANQLSRDHSASKFKLLLSNSR